jgi:hypothetical protein
MAYLDYLRERVHAPVPQVVTLFDPQQEWIKMQIADEILDEWPGCSVKMITTGEESKADMLVVPFEGKSPAHITVPIQNLSSEWIMLYGLERRRIWILPRKQAIALIRQAKRLKSLRRILAKAKIVRPFKWVIQLWKQFACL